MVSKTKTRLLSENKTPQKKIADQQAPDLKPNKKRDASNKRIKKKNEAQFQVFFEYALDAYFLSDMKGNFIDGNQAAEIITGYKRDELIGSNFLENGLLSSDQIPKVAELLQRSRAGSSSGPDKFTLTRKDNKKVSVEIRTHLIQIQGEQTILGVIRDNSEIVKIENAQRKEQERAQRYLDIAEVIMLELDRKGEISLINQKGCQILGYEEEELIGKNWFDTCIPEKQRNSVKQVFKAILSGEDESAKYIENQIVTKSGKERIIKWHNIVVRDDDGQIIGTLSSGEDVMERKRAKEQVRYISFQDDLTDTYNERFFKEQMLRLGKGRSHPISILVAKVNNLKAINDQRGLQVGDVALQSVAKIIKNCFRPDDIVARIEYEKFAILLLGSSNTVAKKASDRIYTGIKNHNNSKDCIVQLSISIGWATAKRSKPLDKIFDMANEKINGV